MKTAIPELKCKPDFAGTVERFEAWWMCEIVDRPPVTLCVKPKRPYTGPTSFTGNFDMPTSQDASQTRTHRTLRDRWLDIEFNIDCAIAQAEQTDWVGDNFPICWPNIGPEITATIYGCDLDFGEETTWSKPVVHRPEDWKRIIGLKPDFTNIYWQTVERLTDRAIERSDGRFIVGISDLHGTYDILAALRDPMPLCTDVLDCPELLDRAARNVARGYVESFHRLYKKVAAAGFGSCTWMPAYHQGPAYVPSCDFWCMVSQHIAREMILPSLLVEMKPFERSIFHLDGPQALPHLELVLELPNLNGLQWVFGAGHGPAARWIDVYRRALQAGKCVQILADDAADGLHVLRALGPRGLWLTIGEPFESVGEAEAYLKEVARVK